MVVLVVVRVTMDVCLMNRYKINVSITSIDQTDDVLEVKMSVSSWWWWWWWWCWLG